MPNYSDNTYFKVNRKRTAEFLFIFSDKKGTVINIDLTAVSAHSLDYFHKRFIVYCPKSR